MRGLVRAENVDPVDEDEASPQSELYPAQMLEGELGDSDSAPIVALE